MISVKSRIFLILLLFLALSASGQGNQRVNKVVRILDEKGRPTAARVRITQNDSVYFAPEGHSTDFPFTNFGGDVILDNNRRFAYVNGLFSISLPVGAMMRIEIVKGFAYKIYDGRIDVSAPGQTIDMQLEKWFEFPGEKWWSGDVHVHNIDPETAMLEMQAEDLNVCNVLTSDFTTDQDRFRGKPEPFSDSLHIVYINQEYREDRLGHVNLLNLKKLIEPVKTPRAFQYPLNMRGLDEARAQGGHVSWAHFAAWPGLEGPLAIVLNKVHSVELLSTIEPFSEPTFVADIVPDLRMNSGLRLWYRLLNCGIKIPATAGTDKMSNWVTVGANRVFALTKGDFTYQGWIDALEKGATFISNSPFIFCTVEGKNPGDEIQVSKSKSVKITAEVWTQFPLDRLEIVANGEVIAERIVEKEQSYVKLEIEFKPSESCWIAARAHQFTEGDRDRGVSFMQRRDFGGGPTYLNRFYGTLRPETTFAHTSPSYVMVDKRQIRSREDAEYFITYLDNGISWLRTSGRFPSESAKQEVLDTFTKGKDLFRKLAE
ncbi:MAG: CehA/McbA family metallohydrolase [Cyclobacteriaceae bacterium]